MPPTTRGERLGGQRLGQAGHALEQAWPPASRQTKSRSMARSWPTITFFDLEDGVARAVRPRAESGEALGHRRVRVGAARPGPIEASGGRGPAGHATLPGGTVPARAVAGGRGRGRPGRRPGPGPAPRGLRGRRGQRRRRRPRAARRAPPTTSSASTSTCPTSTGSRSAGGCGPTRRTRRPRTTAPRVLMLTARDSIDDRVGGPRRRRRRLPRQAVLLRRARGPGAHAAAPRRRPHRRRAPGRASCASTPPASRPGGATALLDLTAKEFALLRYFMTHAGEVLSQEHLLEHVWDEHADPFTNTVRVTVGTLRRKLSEDGEEPAHRDRRRPRLPPAPAGEPCDAPSRRRDRPSAGRRGRRPASPVALRAAWPAACPSGWARSASGSPPCTRCSSSAWPPSWSAASTSASATRLARRSRCRRRRPGVELDPRRATAAASRRS